MDRYIPKKHKQPLPAIREMCIECMGGRNAGYRKLIFECASKDCALYDFRFGKNPHHIKKLTDEQRQWKANLLTQRILPMDGVNGREPYPDLPN